MTHILLVSVAIFGLIIGSFLNVVILRFGTGLSVARGRSRCFSCNHELSWYELIPLVSYIFQMGRCRHCSSRVSIQYPLVEVSTAFFFTLSLVYLRDMGISSSQLVVMSLVLWALTAIYVVITVYDIRHKMIPDFFSYLVAIVALVYVLASHPSDIVMHLVAGVGAFLFFFAFWFFSKGRLMGLGDGKLALSLGLLLGPSSAVTAILMAFWSGAIVSLALIARDKIVDRKLGVSMKSEIPFAPFIVFGILLVFFLNLDMNSISAWLTI